MLTTQKIVPCLWFNGDAEEAAEFYVSLLPDSHIDRVLKSPADTPSVPAGTVLTVEFTLTGLQYVGLNGGSQFPFTEAVSFQIHCDDQPEVDRLWAALAGGGAEIACGWVKDRWGLPWQIVPKRLIELINDPDTGRARRAQEAMMQMVKIDITTIERAADSIS
ncbi:MAG: VOC family protein [Leptolyngbyaceae cyanobacterium bins.302]|nr:VOC family protein [Leptolyngbyaceae cyanobacterium bins.302]